MAAFKSVKFLKRSCVIPGIRAKTKDEAIRELVSRLDHEGLITDADKVCEDIFAREAQMSTGLKGGLAIPHAKSEGADELAVALGLAPDGLDFHSLDGGPAHIIFLLVSHPDRTGPHLECLAEIARFYAEPEKRELLLTARSIRDVFDALNSP